MVITVSALEKRVKRRVRARRQDFYAVVPPGFEQTACRELAEYGIEARPEGRGGVAFSGSWPECWTAHHRARIPARILVRLTRFACTRFEELERQLERFPWELWLQPRQPVAFQVDARSSVLYHEGAIQERAGRCVARRLAPWQAIWPDESAEPEGTQTIYLRNVRDTFTMSLDCSGELLYKRGYDKHVAEAPLRDNLAAAILREADFSTFDTLLDPMAGSGTFGLEALGAQADGGAGALRHFAFELFPACRAAAYRHFLKTNSPPVAAHSRPRQIILRDAQERPLTIMRHNLDALAAAGVKTERVRVEQADFFRTSAASLTGRTLIVMNPPYGARLKNGPSPLTFFKQVGQHLRQRWRGCAFAVMAPGKAAERALALPVDRKILCYNGGISAALLMGRIGA